MKFTLQSGQILLITLLALTLATTIGLALIGRTTIDVGVSNQLDQAAKALSAAEAGIEEALKTGSGTVGTIVIAPGVKYAVTKTEIGGGNANYLFPRVSLKGTSEILWLVAHDDLTGQIIETQFYKDAKLGFCWQNSAALIVLIFYKRIEDSTYQVVRAAWDPDLLRSAMNLFDNRVNSGGCGDSLTNVNVTIDFATLGIAPEDILLALRLRPLYADSQLAVAPVGNLPKQGNSYVATGSTETGLARKVLVNQLYRAPDSFFDYVVYTQGGSFGRQAPQ